MPAVSIIIPTYHRPEALTLAIRSVLAQTIESFEVLVVGDGCTDETEKAVRAFGDPRVKWHNLPSHIGAAFAARNTGLGMARGRIIAYLDHDDVWLPRHLEEGLVKIESGAELVAAKTLILGPPDSHVKKLSGFFPTGRYTQDLRLPTSSLLHEKYLLERMGLWADPRICRLPSEGEFMSRAWLAKALISATNNTTVIHFPSMWRRDSYLTHDAAQQEDYAQKIADPAYPAQLAAEVQQICAEQGEEAFLKMPDPFAVKPGELEKAARRARGFREKPAVTPLQAETTFTLDEQDFPFEWHELEKHPTYGTYRWSGPSCSSSLILPVNIWNGAKIVMRIIGAVDHMVMEQLRLSINGHTLIHSCEKTESGIFIVSATFDGATAPDKPLTLKLGAPYTAFPPNPGHVAQQRKIAYAVNNVCFTPLERAD